MLKISFFGHLNCNFAKLMSKNHATSQKLDFFSNIYNQWVMITTMPNNLKKLFA